MSKYAITGGVRPTALKTVVYGPEGIGKTTFASCFPKAVFIDTEGSTKFFDLARFPVPTSWTMLLDEVQEVINDPTVCDTLVIDTADWAEKMCIAEVCSANNKKGIEDFGYGKGYTYDGRAYLILQLYGCTQTPNEGVKWNPDRIFGEIHRLETEHPQLKGRQIFGVADPSIWDVSRGESVEETASRNFVYFEPGDNHRLPGWMQVHYRLAFDNEGYPMVYFFDTCKAAIRTLPLLRYDEHKPEDLDTSQEDHFADSFRYFCMSRPITPVQAVDKKIFGDDPLNLRGD